MVPTVDEKSAFAPFPYLNFTPTKTVRAYNVLMWQLRAKMKALISDTNITSTETV